MWKTTFQLLNCVECDFGLCFRCATLPYKVKHEDDELQLLTLCYEKDAIKEKMEPKKGYLLYMQ